MNDSVALPEGNEGLKGIEIIISSILPVFPFPCSSASHLWLGSAPQRFASLLFVFVCTYCISVSVFVCVRQKRREILYIFHCMCTGTKETNVNVIKNMIKKLK